MEINLDWLTIVIYGIGLLVNITAVSIIRDKIHNAGSAWANSGRFSVTLVFVIALVLQLLITRDFAAFGSTDAFLEFIKEVATYTMATLGVHAAGKTTLAKKE